MQSVTECYSKVKKDCFRYIASQETRTEKFKNKDKMIKSFLIPVSFYIANRANKEKTMTRKVDTYEYESLEECIKMEQVPPSEIAEIFTDKAFYKWYSKRNFV